MCFLARGAVAPVCLCLLVLGDVSAAGENSFTASNGAVLRAPEVAALSCGEMNTLLMAYSASGYRTLAQPPADHVDREIYDYEDALARAFYNHCQMGSRQHRDPFGSFNEGFD